MSEVKKQLGAKCFGRNCVGCRDVSDCFVSFVSEEEAEEETKAQERMSTSKVEERARAAVDEVNIKHINTCTNDSCERCQALTEVYGECEGCGKIRRKKDLHYCAELAEYYCGFVCRVKKVRQGQEEEKAAERHKSIERQRNKFEQAQVKAKLKALGKKLRGKV